MDDSPFAVRSKEISGSVPGTILFLYGDAWTTFGDSVFFQIFTLSPCETPQFRKKVIKHCEGGIKLFFRCKV